MWPVWDGTEDSTCSKPRSDGAVVFSHVYQGPALVGSCCIFVGRGTREIALSAKYTFGGLALCTSGYTIAIRGSSQSNVRSFG